jgi:urea carboxylase
VIARRIIRTLTRMGLESVAVYSDADRHSPHVAEATEAVRIGPPPAAQSYLKADAILEAARQTGAQAIHPGYGFLSENAEFAERCEEAGIVFAGPTPYQLRAFGLKHTARHLAAQSNVPLLPGTGLLGNVEESLTEAARIGYPVMLKSTAGGGGIGMRRCSDEPELTAAFSAVQRVSQSAFKDSGVYLEKYISSARHIEVQIFGDGLGNVIALGERDCSVQRRHQKLIEETPAPGLPAKTREELLATAVALAKSVSYRNAGTVEFVYDALEEKFYFLEVNTRLQVEHGVTEEVFGVDLVEWMIRLAAGETNFVREFQGTPRGHAIQLRLYAEDPGKNFQPSSGRITSASFPGDLRVETWVEPGAEVSSFYDPMIAKLIAYAPSRSEAIDQLLAGVANTVVSGIETNLGFGRQILEDPVFRRGGVTTRYLDSFEYSAPALEVLDGGTMTTVQDFPGRLGLWNVGVPPSGPIDSLAFRAGNGLLGNPPSAAGLECVLSGPTLRFRSTAVIALTGADMASTLDGKPVTPWSAVHVSAGSVLSLGAISGAGARTYLLVRGGIDVPDYLGSKSTFTLGKFGGHGGRALLPGDVLHIGPEPSEPARTIGCQPPAYSNSWRIGVMYGPHGAPDYFTEDDIEVFFATSWRVHHNSSRTGVRLIGPKPKWARHDGGEAGLHPSNIHDNAYAIGTVDFTGDMPVILGPDGPSLGGFVCPATVVNAELWKIGQLKPGDSVEFVRLQHSQAEELDKAVEVWLDTLDGSPPGAPAPGPPEPAIVSASPGVVMRPSGDRYLLIEFGEPMLDLRLRFRVHALMQAIDRDRPEAIVDVTPGIRSLQIHYDSSRLSRPALLDLVGSAEASLPDLAEREVPSRIVHLPLSWDDPATRLAIERYMKGVRPDAPWCPSNIEFIRRINGLNSIDQVRKIVFDASYLVLGLGDVYLGAPVATPIDPRQRLVTTKYNPARTWTPENAVGIGGAYLCVYGMEGPGGYQFVGRTVQMWNTYRQTPDFPGENRWLLRFFDQIRFYPVSAEELLEMRDAFPYGRFNVNTSSETLSLKSYSDFLRSIEPSAREFKLNQQAAFEAERERWRAAGESEESLAAEVPETQEELRLEPGAFAIKSPAHASIWMVEVEPGQSVAVGGKVVVLEAMKMEIAVASPRAGTVTRVLCKAGAQVTAGQPLLILKEIA